METKLSQVKKNFRQPSTFRRSTFSRSTLELFYVESSTFRFSTFSRLRSVFLRRVAQRSAAPSKFLYKRMKNIKRLGWPIFKNSALLNKTYPSHF